MCRHVYGHVRKHGGSTPLTDEEAAPRLDDVDTYTGLFFFLCPGTFTDIRVDAPLVQLPGPAELVAVLYSYGWLARQLHGTAYFFIFLFS